jgi:hypothetical protein
LTIWIDKQSFLVRRIDSEHTLPQVSFQTTTTFDPIAGADVPVDVPDDLLEFNPPEQK